MAEGSKNKTDGAGKISPPTLTIDWELYGKHLDESDLSNAEKRAFLETIWSIVVSFVDLGFGVHPLQQVTDNACEQQVEITKFITTDSDPVVVSTDITTPKFNASADRQSGLSKNLAQDRSPE
ncbi:MAG: hypothetical protein L3J37_07365 [Rhodobacteraceae bacterium]|nr:hypothetical protein [Paracoccaceae bacterium]